MRNYHNIDSEKWNGHRAGYTTSGRVVRIVGASGRWKMFYGHSAQNTADGLAGKYFAGTRSTLADVSRTLDESND